jgi:hypothetical protein
MSFETYAPADDFRAGHYRGHHFAVMRHHRIWRVFINYKLLENSVFETADEARRWLHREIDAAAR